jgi:hypothetical protein
MTRLRHFFSSLLITTSLILFAAPQLAAELRDGRHDFDFEAGRWKIHLKRLMHPLTGSTEWVEFDGDTVTRHIWGGKAWIEQFESDGAQGHIEGLTLRLYNPESHQWSLNWATSKTGTMWTPAVGEFKDGVGEFYDQEPLNGRMILVRMVWSHITPNSAHSEQSYSDDGGKTWEVNWVTDQTRVPDDQSKWPEPIAGTAAASTEGTPNDFTPMLGDWNYHLRRLPKQLVGSTTWTDLTGTGICYKLWNGRAQLDTIEVDGDSGHIEGLTLRMFNPESQQWQLYWANSRIGKFDPPQVGAFKNGHGDFYATDVINKKVVLIRYDWTATTSDSPHFEQAFSDDGGKTWEVNWITDQVHPAGKAN